MIKFFNLLIILFLMPASAIAKAPEENLKSLQLELPKVSAPVAKGLSLNNFPNSAPTSSLNQAIELTFQGSYSNSSPNYLPYVKVGKLLYISGQLPMSDGKLKIAGKLGNQISIDEGKEAAKLCALQIIAQVKAAIGNLGKVKKCVKITGFVNSSPDFTDQPKVINGASDILVEVFGEKGKHARAAVGVSSLPLGASVEIEAIFEIE